jgi:RNA polymerase sigma-70 factor (ECF subfamily)
LLIFHCDFGHLCYAIFTLSYLLDKYLVFRIRVKGDQNAFAQVYDRYVTSIYRFVFLKLPSKEAAEDVTAETFLRSWQAMRREDRPVANLRAFLYKIARNLVADTYRREGIRKTESLDAVTFGGESASSSLDVSDGHRHERLMEARADLSILLEKISHLKDDYQDVLTLRLVDGLSFRDVASILEKREGHVRVIYHRALKALQNVLDQERSPNETPRL